jgi:putative addiction module killer protein
MRSIPREIVICQKPDGSEPFTEWLDQLDAKTLAIIFLRIDRVEEGNFGDCKPVGDGISELRIDFGPGFRIYFGQVGRQVHLLGAGQKKRQQQDIAAAKKLWSGHD